MANNTVLDERLTNSQGLQWEGIDRVRLLAESAILRSFSDDRGLLEYLILKRVGRTVIIRSIPLGARVTRSLQLAAKGE